MGVWKFSEKMTLKMFTVRQIKTGKRGVNYTFLYGNDSISQCNLCLNSQGLMWKMNTEEIKMSVFLNFVKL